MKKPRLTPLEVRRAMQCAAACDAIVTSEDWSRAFWYEDDWHDGTAMAKYDNGGGDHVFVFFTVDGQAIIKGFDHESDVSPHAREVYEIWPGIYDGVPPALMDLLKDESVEHEDVTFCCWSADGTTWETGSAGIPGGMDDGSSRLLEMIQMNAEEFIDWGQSYYEEGFERIGSDGVRKVYKNGEVPS